MFDSSILSAAGSVNANCKFDVPATNAEGVAVTAKGGFQLPKTTIQSFAEGIAALRGKFAKEEVTVTLPKIVDGILSISLRPAYTGEALADLLEKLQADAKRVLLTPMGAAPVTPPAVTPAVTPPAVNGKKAPVPAVK